MNKYNPRGLPRFHVQQLSRRHQSRPLADTIPAQPTWTLAPPRRKRHATVTVVKSQEHGSRVRGAAFGPLRSFGENTAACGACLLRLEARLFLWERDVGVFPLLPPRWPPALLPLWWKTSFTVKKGLKRLADAVRIKVLVMHAQTRAR